VLGAVSMKVTVARSTKQNVERGNTFVSMCTFEYIMIAGTRLAVLHNFTKLMPDFKLRPSK